MRERVAGRAVPLQRELHRGHDEVAGLDREEGPLPQQPHAVDAPAHHGVHDRSVAVVVLEERALHEVGGGRLVHVDHPRVARARLGVEVHADGDLLADDDGRLVGDGVQERDAAPRARRGRASGRAERVVRRRLAVQRVEEAPERVEGVATAERVQRVHPAERIVRVGRWPRRRLPGLDDRDDDGACAVVSVADVHRDRPDGPRPDPIRAQGPRDVEPPLADHAPVRDRHLLRRARGRAHDREAGRAPGRRLAGLLLARRHMQAEAEELADAEPLVSTVAETSGSSARAARGARTMKTSATRGARSMGAAARRRARVEPPAPDALRCVDLHGTPSGRTPCAPAHLSAIPRTRCLAAAFFAASCCTVGALSS